MSDSTSASESLRFCACAGACDPHPITPILEIPSKALGRRGKRSRPPFTIVSVVSANCTSCVVNTSDVNLFHLYNTISI